MKIVTGFAYLLILFSIDAYSIESDILWSVDSPFRFIKPNIANQGYRILSNENASDFVARYYQNSIEKETPVKDSVWSSVTNIKQRVPKDYIFPKHSSNCEFIKKLHWDV